LTKDEAQALAGSLTDWWALAGVDVAAGDAPADWLRRAAAPPTPLIAASPPAAVIAPSLAAYCAWLAGPDQPEAGWPGPRLAAATESDAAILVVGDVPDLADLDAGAPLAGAPGDLLAAALAAAALGTPVRTALALARPPGGMLDAALLPALGARLRGYVERARPRRLLLLGDRTSRAWSAASGGGTLDGLQRFKHDGHTVAVGAIAHPRDMIRQPYLKAEAWRLLRHMMD
jgi:DNA polymerase